jgi:hypothetical protein
MKGVSPLTVTGIKSSLALLTLVTATARGQLYVASWHTGNYDGTVGLYTPSGTAINASLITGIAQPTGLATDGQGHLFLSGGDHYVKEYTTSGATVHVPLISSVEWPR